MSNTNLQKITGKTRMLCLLGDPVEHSQSPLMHNTACRLLDLDYAYLAFQVTIDHLPRTVEGLKLLGARGWNLTMPLKNAMVPLVDELTDAARLSGSVNTVINDNGRLIGHTTDGIGFMDSAKDAGYDLVKKDLVLLGAGGAASSIVVQAALDGVAAIHVFKRKNASWSSTEQFLSHIQAETGCVITLEDIHDEHTLSQRIGNTNLLVNATNVGMAPDVDVSPVNGKLLYPELPVCDIIYNPMQTKLLRDAAAIGCPTFNGLYMLLYQGAASFEAWTGHEMPVEEIKKTLFTK